MKLYVFRTVRLSIIRSSFTAHSAMVYVMQVCRQLSSRSILPLCVRFEVSIAVWFRSYVMCCLTGWVVTNIAKECKVFTFKGLRIPWKDFLHFKKTFCVLKCLEPQRHSITCWQTVPMWSKTQCFCSVQTDHDPRNPAYIATQGPLPHTAPDFWQMVWEQGSVVMVMLTRLTENGTAMCHRYWPEEGSELYHIYEVKEHCLKIMPCGCL